MIEVYKFSRHGWVAPRELFDAHLLRLVIGQSKVAISPNQCFSCFLEMVDGFVDFFDRCLKFLGGEFLVSTERRLKGFKFIFKVGDVDVLLFDESEFALV